MDLVLVDDDAIVHLFVERLLRRTGLRFEAFTNPERALEWLRTHRPTVLVLDHRMPRLDGPSLLDALGGPCNVAERVVLCTAGSNDPGIAHLVGERGLTIRNKTELLDRGRFLGLLGLSGTPPGTVHGGGEPVQCTAAPIEPASNRVSSTSPQISADGG